MGLPQQVFVSKYLINLPSEKELQQIISDLFLKLRNTKLSLKNCPVYKRSRQLIINFSFMCKPANYFSVVLIIGGIIASVKLKG